jgi:hypothetical protein
MENSHVVAMENSHVVAWENSNVVARQKSNVVARQNSNVEAWENSNVVARQKSNVEARQNSHVVAMENSHVVAWENSHVVAMENSHVEARQNSYVEARENSHVVARGHVILRLFGGRKVTASAHVLIMQHRAPQEGITGGRVMDMPEPSTAAEWCDFYGVTVKDGIAIIYKGVDIDFRSSWGGNYKPGTMPEAKDWDGGDRECGGGLHFSPSPRHTREFNVKAERYVACPVALADMRAPEPWDYHPQKIKAPRVCAPCFEVDIDGAPVVAPVEAA